ncbi:MAG: 5'-nucleotidase C-terminal domain-containing protein [Gammaproteobacteria bacterium]|nr:5'-nucleotidase C-terminal domain-containing protein [Gammaproteobacteria bacterium]MDH5514572.1 5'-nucleotidase C-terminal domain-containing protein [Gammaproteobacteria bacterium]
MKSTIVNTGRRLLWPLALVMGSFTSQAIAENTVTLIEMGDLHGTLVPHAAVLKNADGSERQVASAGGLARLKTVVDDIRADNPEAVLLSAGDLTHGSAETLFTVGDIMMKAMNAFDIDVFTPGNWDFGYGPAVFRNRFASFGPKPGIPPNIAVMAGYIDCSDNTCTEEKGIIRADFPSVAINLYNAAPIPAALQGKRVLDPYRILERGGVKIAVIGITAPIVPQQADVFNIGLRFTQGVEELPDILAEVNAAGADLIVVQSELGMSQNIEIARNFKDIDVMYSAHTHEITLGALLADESGVVRTTPGLPLSGAEKSLLARGAAIVVETNRDMYVGRLDVQVADGKVIDFEWQAIPVDDSIPADPAMAALVAELEEDFIAGEDGIVKTHVFLPGAYCTPGCGAPGERGHYLTDSLDMVVGETDTLLLRHHVLEDTLNNWLADAIRTETDEVVFNAGNDPWNGVDISMSNGFRFGNAVLPGGDITLRDLYTWFPVGPAIIVGEFAGQAIEASLEEILSAVFNRNAFLQRGGWYLGLANMTQEIDLDNRPFSSSSGRIVQTKIGGAPLDTSKRYVFASCYGHGDAIDRVCRSGGGSEHRFLELADATDYTSAISITDPVLLPPTGPIRRSAPFRYVHPVHLLRRHLDRIGTVTDAYGVGRIKTVDSRQQDASGEYPAVPAPVSAPDPTFVQPPQGAGPKFFSGHIGH